MGAFVRDSIIGIEPSDWDITTSALPDEIMKCFEEYRVIETGVYVFKKVLLIKKGYIKSIENLKDERLNNIKQIELILDNILEKNQCYNLKGLAINGTDLFKMGLPKGKYIGEVLSELLNLVVEEILDNKKEELINYI